LTVFQLVIDATIFLKKFICFVLKCDVCRIFYSASIALCYGFARKLAAYGQNMMWVQQSDGLMNDFIQQTIISMILAFC
jgi:hypothetical protein